MENPRASKRRKLDTPGNERSRDSPVQQPTKTPTLLDQRNIPTGQPRVVANGTISASGAHNDWKQAKAKAQELRGKRVTSTPQKSTNVDVYDDIDGAHSGRSRLKPLANSASKAKQLDPLRNQTSASTVASSPAKANGGLDFFKRFAKPKGQEETPKKKVGQDLVNGTKSHAENGLPSEEQQEEGMQEPHRSTSATRSGKGAWKSWAYAEKSKKTFEDEIRELETAAKEKVEHEEDGGISDRAALRRRRRQSPTPLVAHEKAAIAPTAKFAPVTTPRTFKTAGRPKTPVAEIVTVRNSDRAAPGEKTNVDEVVNELEQQLQAETGSAPSAATPFKQKLQQPTKKAQQPLSNVIFEAEHLDTIKSVVLQQLTSDRPTCLANLDDEYGKVSNVIEQAITAGESNSMLLIGSRGSGKTTLINQILREQAIEHPDDFHVVRLNGFIHTDDKIALREIWRQLGREMELDEEESSLKNYADTLTSLLALLSHPAEQGREQQKGHVTKSVIFILDEFELFASHPRQTLLYNLFDIAQSRKAPITVLGLTTRIDVAESLEKRVKSRFSHRYVHLSSAKSCVAFQEACKAALIIRHDDLDEYEKLCLSAVSMKAAKKAAGTAVDHWSSLIEALFSQDEMTDHLRHIYYTTKSVSEFQTSMLLPLSTLPTTNDANASDLLTHLIPTSAASGPDSKLSLLSSLSTLHLALLICGARLTAIHAQDTIPFAQAYEEYKSIASKAKIQASASGALAQGAGARIWGKEVARGIWGKLVEMGLVMEDGVRGGRVDVGLEEIGMCGVELGAWGRWCREI